jgi:hypothetical protein
MKHYLWAAQWHSKCRLDGETKYLCYSSDCLPKLFRTRAACRAWIKAKYGYIAERPDLRAEPFGWKMPKPVRVQLVVYELTK